MNLGLRSARTCFLAIILYSVLVVNLNADTGSWPVSVAIPTSMSGDLLSKPVSVGLPASMSGELGSKPVSVGIRASNPDQAPPIVNPVSSPTRFASLVLSGTKNADTYLYINNNRTTIPLANTLWSYPLVLMEGENNVSLFTMTATGSQSTAVNVVVVLDTTSSSFSNVSMLSNDSYTNNLALNFLGMVSDTNLNQVAVSLDNPGQVAVNQSANVQSGAFNSAVQLRAGINHVTIIAIDPAGNEASVSRTINFDNNRPFITVNTPADNSSSRSGTITVSGIVDRPATVMVGGNAAAITMDGAKTNFSATVDLQTQGSHQIDIVATDLNSKSTSQKRTIMFDSIKPQLAITVPGQDLVTRNATETITATVSGVDPFIVTGTFNGVIAPLTLNNGTYSFSVDFSTLTQGTYPVTVTATDAAGNSSSATRTLIFNTTRPILTIDQMPSETGTANITLSGTAETNVTYNIFNTATDSSGTAAVNEGIWTYAVTLAPGPNTFTVEAKDEANNPTTRTVSISYLLPAPALTIDPVGPYVNQPSPIITGTVDSGATVNVSVNEAPAVAATVSGGTWSCQLTGLRQGESNSVTVTATKPSTYAATAPPTSFIWDTVSPAQPGITTIPTSPTTSGSGTILGIKDANSYLYVGTTKTDIPFADTSWSYTANINEGSNQFVFSARDEAGNQGSTATVTVVRDTTAPTRVSSTPAANAVTNNPSAISVILTDGATGSGVNLDASRNGAVVRTSSGAAVDGSWSVAGTALVFTPTLPQSLSDGIYTVTLHPVDLIGNPSGTDTFSFTLDRTLPMVQLLPLSPQSPVKAGTVTFTLNFSEAMETTQSAVTFTRGLLHSTYTLNGSWISPTMWRGSYQFSSDTGDGTYTVTVSGAKDLVGNTMADQEAGTFVLDTTPPTNPTVTSPATFTTPTNVKTLALAGGKDANSAIVINGAVRVPVNSSTIWSYSYPLVEGENNLIIKARDAAGNDSAAITPAPAITLDTTPPLFTIDTYPATTSGTSVTISGTKDSGCIVKMGTTSPPTTVIFDSTNTSATWSYQVTLAAGLSNHFIFTAADALGNITSRTIDIVSDTVAPQALTAGMLVADGSGKGTEVSLAWPSYPEPVNLAYYRVYYSSVSPFPLVTELASVGTVSKGTKSFKVIGLSKGTGYYFAVVPVSASGMFESTVHTALATPTDTVAPEEVTGLKAQTVGYNGSDNYVSLIWTPSANSSVDLSDQLVYFDSGQGYDSGTSIGPTATSYTKSGLSDATAYRFKVKVKDTTGNVSNGVSTTAVTRLANPAGLTATPGSQSVTLSWPPVSLQYFKQFNIYKLPSDVQQTDVSTMAFVKSQTGTTFTDTGLTNGTAYQYAVTTVNTSGAERTNVLSVTAMPRSDATGPVISGVNITSGQVITAPITIQASAVDAPASLGGAPESAMGRIELWIDGIQRDSQNGGSFSSLWNVAAATVTDGNHTVRIVAYDAPGNPTEQIIPVVVSLSPPAVPVINSTFNSTINQPTVTITGTAQQGATVYLRVNGVVVAQTTATDSVFTFSSIALTEGINSVAVKAGNRGGDSPFSVDTKITVVTTSPTAPLNLVAKPLAGGSIQFSWQAGGSGAVGYNLYEGPTAFTAVTDSSVHKTNSAPMPYPFKEYIPADDTPRFYAVTAIDGAGNESPVSNLATIAADRAAPSAGTVSFTDGSGVVAADNIYGPGTVQISLTVSEPLSEAPFLSLEPQKASPVIVSLSKVDDTHYTGSITLDATLPQGPTTWKFSGKDLVGNRGNATGTGPVIDVKGPMATITTPVTLLKTTAGAIAVSLTFDEPSTTTPALTLKAANNTTASVEGLVSGDNGTSWSGTISAVSLAALGEGPAKFLLAGAKDRFGNVGTTVKTGGTILLYSNTPPAPSVPTDLAAKSGKGGSVTLTWAKVADAQGYNVYRQGTGESSPTLITSISTGTTVTYTDTPASDGSYAYSVSVLGLLSSESAQSAPVTAASDRTPPAVPTGLALTLTGNGINAVWDFSAPAEIPVSYRLYRAATYFTELTGLSAVTTAKTATATDPSPVTTQRFYAVTALDAAGNESAPIPAQEISFPVAPVGNLDVSIVDDGKPSLSWSSAAADLQGFYIYRNGARINQTPTSSTSYSDGYYSGGTVTYGVSAVDSAGAESPRKEATLPALTVGLKEGTTMHRGVLEKVKLVAATSAGTGANLAIDAVSVKIGTLPESTANGPYTVEPGKPLEIEKVTATEVNAPPQVAVVVTAVMTPSPGTTVKVTRASLATVIGSGTALEIFNDPLVRGTQASVRLKVNNLGTARTEFLTSENGGATSHVTITLSDQDGNVLAQGNLNQQTGNVMNGDGYAAAQIEPGGSFLSRPITFAIPASAPANVFVEARIDNTYYHYGDTDQVTAPGLKQSVAGKMADVAYLATATTDKTIYKQGEAVVISGQVTSATDGQPVPVVPVKIGVSVKGFDRFFTATSDSTGAFSYTFTPSANEAGSYSIWATHPDLADRTVQAEFSVIGLIVSPNLVNVTFLKGQNIDIPVTITNLGNASLSGLTFTPSASTGMTATVVNPGSDTLAGGESRTVGFRITTTTNSPESGYASLSTVTAEGLTGKVDANVTLVDPIPLITTAPSYIYTGIMRGNQRIENFTIGNSGYETLKNARIEGPSLPWLSLTVDINLGDVAAGQEKTIGIVIKPDENVAQGIYNDRLVVYSDNHIPYTYNVVVSVTSSAVGSVQFSLLNELMKQVAGATITVQNQNVPSLVYSLTSASDGTASLFDLPEGPYSFFISAPDHKPHAGNVTITSGITASMPIALEVNLVDIQWSVVPTTIQDQYQIVLTQKFATEVPTSVLITEPPVTDLPDMNPGETYNGSFTITNYGLVAVESFKLSFPSSVDDYDIEVLGSVPSTLNAMQKITVSFRVTRRISLAYETGTYEFANLFEEIPSYGGSTISCHTADINGSGNQTICPCTPQQKEVTKWTTHTIKPKCTNKEAFIKMYCDYASPLIAAGAGAIQNSGLMTLQPELALAGAGAGAVNSIITSSVCPGDPTNLATYTGFASLYATAKNINATVSVFVNITDISANVVNICGNIGKDRK